MSTETTTTTKTSTRRKFLLAAGATGAAAVAMPQVSRAQTVTWKYQSTWPTKDIFHEFAVDYAKKVNEMSGGRLKLDVLAAGAVVPAFQMAGRGAFRHSRRRPRRLRLLVRQAQGLFAVRHPARPSAGTRTASSAGSTTAAARRSTRSWSTTSSSSTSSASSTIPMPTQPLGWFKKEVKTADDLKGIKYRTVGLSADLFKEMGAAVTIMPGGEIVPALDRGLLDAAEFNNPSSDILLGFPDVAKNYMLRQPPPAGGDLRDHLQQGQVRRPAGRAEGDPAHTPPSPPPPTRIRHGLRPLFEGSRSDQGARRAMSSRRRTRCCKAQLAAWDKVIDEPVARSRSSRRSSTRRRPG